MISYLKRAFDAHPSWSDPIESWAALRTAISARLYRYVDFGFTMPVVSGLFYRILDVSHDRRLREIEADFLEDR